MTADSYLGDEKIVFGFDLGTTQTAVSYVHLQDSVSPHVRLVTKWPGQEDASGDCKLPTLVRYDEHGKPVSYGAEALENASGDEGPLARWFKLHLHPASMKTNAGAALEIPPLPSGVTLKQVYTHWLRYIYAHATSFFRDQSLDGPTIWDRVKDRVGIILAIPNGWDLAQQTFLRDAVVLAGILPQGHDSKRMMFVSEAEASVHYALMHADGDRWLKPGMTFCVLDAGGSTVDTTLYKCIAVTPKPELEEVTASGCVQAGSVFVDRDAEKMLRLKLANSKFADDEYIQDMVTVFERKTKRKFDGGPEASVIAFGHARDNDPSVNISKGRITLSSGEVGLAFQNALFDIGESFQQVLERAKGECHSLLLVGGFSESPYLRKVLREKNDQRGMRTISIDDGTKKAAAEGAVLWYLRQTVVARAIRAHFGTDVTAIYDPSNSHHLTRATHSYIDEDDGTNRISDVFSIWCKKHQIIRNAEAQRFDYHLTWARKEDITIESLRAYTVLVYACDDAQAPYFLHEQPTRAHRSDRQLSPGMRHVCGISADLSALRDTVALCKSDTKEQFYKLQFSVKVWFGQTALSAQICWLENGAERASPMEIIPNSLL
ncbi:hypothetical protein BKA62DRAFT_263816 [Auriculariales sp. MPI-PUGE-AT-0066]|nr:hypothetical protein BKA62DRAFT_263816 [Auriculariales sp. MPI-PUGE-AT-0066]